MIAELPLVRGGVAIIDEADLPLVGSRAWTLSPARSPSTSYVVASTTLNGETTVPRLHRVILGAKPGQSVDHINGNGLDNRRSNLRICTHAENMRNRRRNYNNKSGYKGVTPDRNGRYRVNIGIDGKFIALGCYASPEEGAWAYDRAAVEHFGPFARLNFDPARDWLDISIFTDKRRSPA